MKRILIIGAGNDSVALVIRAKQRGLYVIVVSPLGNYPALKLADEIFNCDIYDCKKILDFAVANNVIAVLTQSERAIVTTAYLCEKLKLKGNNRSQVLSYVRKNKFRDHCVSIGVPVPHYAVFKGGEMPNHSLTKLPCIVKPVDSLGSIGVKRVTDLKYLNNAVEKAYDKSIEKEILVEQFITGKEVVCEGLIYDGKYYNLSFGDRVYFNINNIMIPCQTIFPSLLPEYKKQEIIEYDSKLAQKLKPDFAIVHSEYLIENETNDVYIVESSLRGGGVYIASDLVPYAVNIDVSNLILDYVLGEKIEIDKIMQERLNRASMYMCFTLPVGTVIKVDGEEQLNKIKGVDISKYLNRIKIGDKISDMTDKGMRRGPILIYANNVNELREKVEEVKGAFFITVLTKDGEEKGIVWN